ncbi:MAG: hypothetical protein JWL59_4470 [Chthoniobacteraceae bacterium]|nr:hypothetical protein [Chthoniobacteraceae bacterium]
MKGSFVKDLKKRDPWIFQMSVETAKSLPKQRETCLTFEAFILFPLFPFLLACEEHPGIWRIFGDPIAMETIGGELALNLAVAEGTDIQIYPPNEVPTE